jgi:hypothetical protein
VLYGLSVSEFDRESGGKGVFEDVNITDLNSVDVYLKELALRIADAHDAVRGE